jgi:DNA-binding NarL/FixJ family response regulator
MFGLFKKQREITKMKFHQNEQFLRKAIELGSTSKEIANELRVSYKLVELYLHKFNIPFTSQKP